MPNFVPVVYSNGGPVLASNGGQRVACAHLAQWLKVYDALQVARGRGHVVYYQTMGGADASAGTHNCGSAWDMQYTGTAPIMDAREMGAADWPRLHSNGWVGGEHVHGLIRCGDNGCNGYQYTAWLSGHNGLGLNGVGAGDTLPKPSTIRTWQQGIAWAQAQMGVGPMTQTTNSPAPQQEDSMIVLGGIGLPAYLVNSSGAVVSLNAEHLSIALAMQAGDTHHLNALELEQAKDIINALRENKGF